MSAGKRVQRLHTVVTIYQQVTNININISIGEIHV
jgi:hypothetical protein